MKRKNSGKIPQSISYLASKFLIDTDEYGWRKSLCESLHLDINVLKQWVRRGVPNWAIIKYIPESINSTSAPAPVIKKPQIKIEKIAEALNALNNSVSIQKTQIEQYLKKIENQNSRIISLLTTTGGGKKRK